MATYFYTIEPSHCASALHFVMHLANEPRLESVDVMQNSMTVCKLTIFFKSVKLYDEWEKSLSSDHLLRRWSLFRHHASFLHPQFLAFLGVEFGGPLHLGNHHLVTSNLRFLPQGIPTTPSVSQCRISFLSYRVQVWSLSQFFVKLRSIFLLSRRLSFHPTKLHWNDSVRWNDTLGDSRKMDPKIKFRKFENLNFSENLLKSECLETSENLT